MTKITKPPQPSLFPAPAVLVSCQGQEKPNIITLAWAGIACSKPVVVGVGIRPERHSYDIISKSGEFVVNIPQADQRALVDHCGLVSGEDHDKFAECGLTPFPGKLVKAPLIKECPINLECRVLQQIALGSHDLFLGEVVLVHYSEQCVVNGRFDPALVDPLAYGFGRYFRLSEALGRHGDSALKKR